VVGCEIDGFGIHIKVADFEKSRKFYESLGFKPVFGYGDEEYRKTLPKGVGSAPERYRGIVFQAGASGMIDVSEGHLAVKNKNVFKEVIISPKISAMVKVKSLVPLFKNPNVKITFPVRHYYWNSIEAAFRDPDGFVLVFIAPYSEKEFKEVSKYTKIEVIKP